MNTPTRLLLPLMIACSAWSLAPAQCAPTGGCPPSWASAVTADEDEDTSPARPRIQWVKDYDEAMATAKKEKKVVMIDFYTDWCGWCKVLDRETFSDPKVVAVATDRLVALKIDGDARKDLVKKYEVVGFPNVVFVSPENKVVHKMSGFRPPNRFLPEMTAAAAGKSPGEYQKELVEKGTADPELQVWIASKFIEEKKWDEALTWLGKAMDKLSDADKVEPQMITAYILLESGEKDKARAAFEVLRRNPETDPETLAEWEVGFAQTLGDKPRMAAALDRLLELTEDENKKRQIRFIKDEMERTNP